LGLISIAEKTDDWKQMHDYLLMMRDRVKSMDAFIREITDYSRNSRLEISKESVPIHSLIKGIIENLKYIDGADQINVEIGVPTDKLIVTDMSRIRVVLNNLISNALKYHDLRKDNPYIKITCNTVDGEHQLRIEENGQGIRAEHQNKIFNMFYRASENSDGSGLGLYIVKETLDKLHGTITVKSEYGMGSTFTVLLPNN
jgi:signal transduction histidine kinase